MAERGIAEELSTLLDVAGERLERGVDEVKAYLGTPEGRELRRRIAQALIIGAPLLFRFKFFRATWVGRMVGVVGGAAAVVKLAEVLRDWEPDVGLEPEAPR